MHYPICSAEWLWTSLLTHFFQADEKWKTPNSPLAFSMYWKPPKMEQSHVHSAGRNFVFTATLSTENTAKNTLVGGGCLCVVGTASLWSIPSFFHFGLKGAKGLFISSTWVHFELTQFFGFTRRLHRRRNDSQCYISNGALSHSTLQRLKDAEVRCQSNILQSAAQLQGFISRRGQIAGRVTSQPAIKQSL